MIAYKRADAPEQTMQEAAEEFARTYARKARDYDRALFLRLLTAYLRARSFAYPNQGAVDMTRVIRMLALGFKERNRFKRFAARIV